MLAPACSAQIGREMVPAAFEATSVLSQQEPLSMASQQGGWYQASTFCQLEGAESPRGEWTSVLRASLGLFSLPSCAVPSWSSSAFLVSASQVQGGGNMDLGLMLPTL